jgi:hypothetical protein
MIGTFLALVLIGFFARLSYGMARTPLFAFFAKALGAALAALGLVVGMSTALRHGLPADQPGVPAILRGDIGRASGGHGGVPDLRQGAQKKGSMGPGNEAHTIVGLKKWKFWFTSFGTWTSNARIYCYS